MDKDTKEVLDKFEHSILRMESKLDLLSNVVTQIAVLQERVVSMQEKHNTVEDRMETQRVEMEALKKELREQELLIFNNTRVTGIVSKVSWVVVAAVIGLIAKLIMGDST